MLIDGSNESMSIDELLDFRCEAYQRLQQEVENEEPERSYGSDFPERKNNWKVEGAVVYWERLLL